MLCLSRVLFSISVVILFRPGKAARVGGFSSVLTCVLLLLLLLLIFAPKVAICELISLPSLFSFFLSCTFSQQPCMIFVFFIGVIAFWRMRITRSFFLSFNSVVLPCIMSMNAVLFGIVVYPVLVRMYVHMAIKLVKLPLLRDADRSSVVVFTIYLSEKRKEEETTRNS